MATPKQLVEGVAGVLGISVASVIVHDRNLSSAPVPLRTVAGRGRAAAKMTAVDAANLVIAVAGSESVKNSVWAVLTYGGLRGTKTRKTATGVRSFDELPANHSLAEMLAALIDGVAVGELPSKDFSLTVRLCSPRPYVDLEYCLPAMMGEGLGETNIRYELKPKSKRAGESGDLFRETVFSELTILRVGALIGSLE
jgi:hypothetical protein